MIQSGSKLSVEKWPHLRRLPTYRPAIDFLDNFENSSHVEWVENIKSGNLPKISVSVDKSTPIFKTVMDWHE